MGYTVQRPVLTVSSPDPASLATPGRWTTSEQKDNALFRTVLNQLIEPDAGQPVRKKYVVVDTDRIHFAKPVLAFLEAHQDELEVVCLPTSSPKLNPVERFWKHVRRKVTHNHFFQTMG